jgi:hypothetical protein
MDAWFPVILIGMLQPWWSVWVRVLRTSLRDTIWRAHATSLPKNRCKCNLDEPLQRERASLYFGLQNRAL